MSRRKKVLFDKINNLGPTEHMEIFKILKDHDIHYTENANGVFFNLTTLTEDIFEKVGEFVEYCCDNKKELDEYDQRLQECKYNNNKTRLLLPNSVREPTSRKDNQKDLLEKIDRGHAIQDFVHKLHASHEKSVSKRVNTKFAIARKRFLKRAPDIQDTLVDELAREPHYAL